MAYINNPFGAFGDDASNMGMLGYDIVNTTEPSGDWGVDLTTLNTPAATTAAASSGSSSQDWTQAIAAGLGLTGTLINAATGHSASPSTSALTAPKPKATTSLSSLVPFALIGVAGVVALMIFKKK